MLDSLKTAGVVVIFAWCFVWILAAVSSACLMLVAHYALGQVVTGTYQPLDLQPPIAAFKRKVMLLGLAEEWLLGHLRPTPAAKWLASRHWMTRCLIYKTAETLVAVAVYWAWF